MGHIAGRVIRGRLVGELRQARARLVLGWQHLMSVDAIVLPLGPKAGVTYAPEVGLLGPACTWTSTEKLLGAA